MVPLHIARQVQVCGSQRFRGASEAEETEAVSSSRAVVMAGWDSYLGGAVSMVMMLESRGRRRARRFREDVGEFGAMLNRSSRNDGVGS